MPVFCVAFWLKKAVNFTPSKILLLGFISTLTLKMHFPLMVPGWWFQSLWLKWKFDLFYLLWWKDKYKCDILELLQTKAAFCLVWIFFKLMLAIDYHCVCSVKKAIIFFFKKKEKFRCQRADKVLQSELWFTLLQTAKSLDNCRYICNSCRARSMLSGAQIRH